MKQETALAIFVKTPGYSEVKTRLAKGIGNEAALTFHLLSARCVGEVAMHASEWVTLRPYYAVAEKDALHCEPWTTLATLYQGEGKLGARLHTVYSQLQSKFGTVILLGADSPQIKTEDLRTAALWLSDRREIRFCIGPAVDGGFWLLGGNVPLSSPVLTEIEYSQADTGLQLHQRLAPIGQVKNLRVLSDVDTCDDLPLITEDLNQLESPSPSQTEMRQFLKTISLTLSQRNVGSK